ncbi:aromatic amino acid transaminase [Propionivibrio soli]|uniref:amino acid aminotransferase n=1 Tax=Propionivibrio soli TaxID=2976531 RepID=UPI0021E7D415|nr:amino acid aminotransferase [Propionivibrio soli]
MTSSIFSSVEMAPRDPILGLTEAFNADPRPTKVNLGVGVYFDENGKIPLLNAVKIAEKKRVETAPARGYQPIDGLPAYNKAVQVMLFGEGSQILSEGRVVTVESLGGTGALKVGADYLKRLLPNTTVYISDPSWENHRGVFENAGLTVDVYPYYDEPTHGVNFDAMKAKFNALPADSVVVLHACCHNPTGADLTETQWAEIIGIIRERKLVAFIDMAYQGFAESIAKDAVALKLFVESGVQFFVATSYSKSFSMYGERVGALSVITSSKDESARVLSQIKRIVRTNYSNPPTHGGAIVAAVLSDVELRAMWEQELAGMRDRIRTMRHSLAEKLKAVGTSQDFSFVTKQRGMFSYTGLSAEQVARMQSEFGVYAVSTGRICVAALNTKNIDYVVDAIAAVL